MNRFRNLPALTYLLCLMALGTLRAQTSTTPTGLSVNVTYGGSICLQWTANTTTPIPYEVERSDDGRNGWSKVGDSQPAASGPFSGGSYCDENLLSSRTYYYRVRGSLGRGAYTNYSNMASGTTKAAPSAPSLTLTAQPGSIRVSWITQLSTIYELERRDGQQGAFQVIHTENSARNSTITFNSNGNAGQQYCFRVRAKDPQLGMSDYSRVICETVLPEIPITPMGLTVSVTSSTELQVYWNDINAIPVTFSLERAEGTGGTYREIASGYAVKIYYDKGLNPATQYCYRVRSKSNSGGYSNYATSACNTTQAPPATAPIRPTNLKATSLSSTDIKLTWTDNSPNETRFELQRSLTGNDPWENVDTNIQPNTQEKTDGGRNPSTRYYYRIRAVLVVGTNTLNSDWSDVANDITPAPPTQKPAAPTDLVVTLQSSNEILLAWKDRSDNETGFEINRSEDGGSTWKTVKTEGRNVESYVDGGLTAGKNYCYRVRAVTATDQSGYVGPECKITPPAPAGAPQNFSATALSTTDIKLTWIGVSGASNYELDRSLTGTDPWTRVINPAGNATEFTDGSRLANTRYYYRIRALNAANVAGPYSTADATTKTAVVIVPEPPTNLSSTAVSATQIDLKWTASTATFGSGYVVEQSSPQGGSYAPIIEVSGLATSAFSVTGLQPSTQYCYRVRTKYTTNSNPGNEACATTQAPPLTLPRAPSGLSVVATSSTDIKLTWMDNSTNESSFEIEQGDSQTGTFTKVQTTGVDVKEFIVSGLQSSRNYCFQVRSINGAGKSAYAGPLCATTQAPPITQPAAPATFVANAVSTSVINLSWIDKSDNETGFEIQWNTTGNDPWTSLPNQTSNVTAFVHTGLTANTRYYYRLRAFNTAKQSDWVLVNALTPNLPVPTTSTDLKAQLVDYDRVMLTWMPVGNTPTGIVVERSTSPTSGFTSVTQLAGTATQYTDKDLAEKNTYYYRIRAVNTYGSSDNSNVAPVTTPETIIAVRRQPLPEGIYVYVKDHTLLVNLNWSYFQEATLRVISLKGRDLLTDQCRANGMTLFQYDVAHLPAGAYVLCLDTDQTRYSKTIWIP